MSLIVVYWIDPVDGAAHFEEFEEGAQQLSLMLARCHELKVGGMLFVTSCSHDTVTGGIVRDGKLPDGRPYTWKKRRP